LGLANSTCIISQTLTIQSAAVGANSAVEQPIEGSLDRNDTSDLDERFELEKTLQAFEQRSRM
jgi:hypothetical protein